MYIRNFIMVVIMGTFLMGCADNPQKMYASLSHANNTVAFGSADVIKKANVIVLPKTIHGMSFKRESFQITADDAVIDFGGYKSNYKLFSFQLNEGDQFSIPVSSFCKCLGFDKRILVPKTFVLDADGNEVTINSSERMSTLALISYGIKGQANKTGTYYLVVAANNSALGAGVSTEETMMDGYKPTGIMVSNKSNPYGKVMVSYEVLTE